MRALRALADDFDAQLPIVAGAILDMAAQSPVPVLLEEGTPVFKDPETKVLPMTAHQRIFQWPSVGPVSNAGGPPVLVAAPVELSQLDAGIVLAIPEVLLPFDELKEDSFSAAIDSMAELVIPRPRINQMGFRNQWTARQSDPIAFSMRLKPVMEGSSVRFIISGVTRNGSGAALGGCTVSVFRVDELAYPNDPDVFSDPLIAQTTSDGSGNYSVEVRGPGPYQLTAYLAGAPDVAGVTVNTITPVAT